MLCYHFYFIFVFYGGETRYQYRHVHLRPIVYSTHNDVTLAHVNNGQFTNELAYRAVISGVNTSVRNGYMSNYCMIYYNDLFIFQLFNIAGPLNVAISGISNAFLANVACAGGVFLGMATAMSNSGAHLNPIVTTSFASRGLFPWKKAPHYIIAQYLG